MVGYRYSHQVLFIIFPYLLACLTFTALTSCQNDTDSDPTDPIEIGVLFPMTGDAASYGQKGQRGIQLAVSNANEEDGSSEIKTIVEDSKADPSTGTSAMQKLVNIDGVSAVVGDIVSSVTLAVAPIAERNEVVLLSPTSSAPAITDAGNYIFRIWPSDLKEGEAIAELALKRGYQRAAILHLNNDYGISIAEIFEKTFEQQEDASVVEVDSYQRDAGDYRTALTRIGQKNPGVIYIAGYYADTATILRQARELNIGAQFLGTTAIEDDEFLQLAGDAANGIIYPLATGFSASSKKTDIQNFVSSFEKEYGYTPGWVEAQCYEAMTLIIKATRKTKGKVGGTSIKNYLENMPQYDGVTGNFTFDKNGDVEKPIRFKKVKDGNFVRIEGESIKPE